MAGTSSEDLASFLTPPVRDCQQAPSWGRGPFSIDSHRYLIMLVMAVGIGRLIQDYRMA